VGLKTRLILFSSTLFVLICFHDPYAQTPYSELSLSQKAEVQEILRYLFQLGSFDSDQGEWTGLLGEQNRRLEIARKRYEAFGKNSPEFLESIQSVFDLRQTAIDWNYLYERNLEDEPARILAHYQGICEMLPPERRASFADFRKIARMEIDQKIYRLQNPIFSTYQLLPAAQNINPDDLIQFLAQAASANLIQRIQNFEVLSYEDFEAWWIQRNLPEQNLKLNYFYYLSLGSFLPETLNTREGLLAHFQLAREAAEGNEQFIKFIDFYWPLLDEIHTSSKNIPKFLEASNWTDEEITRLSGALWVEQNFGRDWPEFNDDQELQRMMNGDDSESLGVFSESVDKMVSVSLLFTESERESYRLALREILAKTWLESKSSYYSKLNERMRNLLAARLFPDLNIRESRLLLEARLNEMTDSDFVSLVSKVFLDDPSRSQFLKSLRLREINKLQTRVDLSMNLLSIYQVQRDPKTNIAANLENASKESELLYGKTLPRAAWARAAMEESIEHASDSIDYGWLPKSLVDFLMINLFPYPNYLEDEIYRFVNELDRRRILRSELPDAQQLELLFDSQERPLTDLSSPAVYLAGYWDGFWQNPETIPQKILAGAAFIVALRVLGKRWVLGFILGDTGLKLGTAIYYDETDSEWYRVPLDQGVSLPYDLGIGEAGAASIQQVGKVLQGLLHPVKEEDRLEAVWELGMLSSDVVWFSAGATTSAKLLSLRAPAYLREQNRFEAQLRRSYKSLERHEAQIQDIELKLSNLRKSVEKNVDENLARFLDEKLWLEQRLMRLQTGLKSYHPNLIRKVFGGSFELVKRIGSYFLWINEKPRRIRLEHRSVRSRLERWYAGRRALPGYSQIEYQIAQIETKIADSRANFLSKTSQPADLSFHRRGSRSMDPQQIYEARLSLDRNLTKAAKAWEKWESTSGEFPEASTQNFRHLDISSKFFEESMLSLQSWLDQIRLQSQALKQVNLRATDQLPRPLRQVNLEAEISKFLDKEWSDFFRSSDRLIRLGRIMEKSLADRDSLQLSMSQLEALKFNFEKLNQFRAELTGLYRESMTAHPVVATPIAPQSMIDQLVKRPGQRTKSIVESPEWQSWLESREWQSSPNKVPPSLENIEVQSLSLGDGFHAFRYLSARETPELLIGKWIGDQFRIFSKIQFITR